MRTLIFTFLTLLLVGCTQTRKLRKCPTKDPGTTKEKTYTKNEVEKLIHIYKSVKRDVLISSFEKDAILKSWKVDEADLSHFVKDYLVADSNINGNWSTCIYLAGSGMHIQKNMNGQYTIVFHVMGNFDEFYLVRKAVFQEGKLILDNPVIGYVPDKSENAYKILYAIKKHESIYLIPQTYLRYLFEKKFVNNTINWVRIRGMSFSKVYNNRHTSINGSVVKIDKDRIFLDMGEDKGVQKGMTLSISRDNNFIGWVEIISVIGNNSITKVFHVISDQKIQVGDRASLSFH